MRAPRSWRISVLRHRDTTTHLRRPRFTTLLRWLASPFTRPIAITRRGSGFTVAAASTGDTFTRVITLTGANQRAVACLLSLPAVAGDAVRVSSDPRGFLWPRRLGRSFCRDLIYYVGTISPLPARQHQQSKRDEREIRIPLISEKSCRYLG
jgi:hypothetical protein